MSDGEEIAALRYQRTERVFAAAYLLCVMVLQAHFVHDGWFGLLHPAGWQAVATHDSRGTFAPYAPDVYRIGMELVNFALFPVLSDASYRLTLIDFAVGFPALYALYLLQSTLVPLRAADRSRRVITLALFVASLHFALAWVVPYQRPETMAMTLYLAASGLMLLRVRNHAGWVYGLIGLAIVTAFFRSDVPCFFGVALLLLGACGNELCDLASRRACVLLGSGIAAGAAAIQALLQFVVFPRAVYPPGVPPVMLRYNLRFHSLSSVAIALLPLLIVAAAGLLLRVRIRSLDWLYITASAIYLPLWCAVGSVAEVRIFVPFMFLLCPVAATVMAAILGFHDDMQTAC